MRSIAEACGHATPAHHECRGLCRNCYQRLRQRVKRGTVTWEALEAEGQCKPLGKVRRAAARPASRPGGDPATPGTPAAQSGAAVIAAAVALVDAVDEADKAALDLALAGLEKAVRAYLRVRPEPGSRVPPQRPGRPVKMVKPGDEY